MKDFLQVVITSLILVYLITHFVMISCEVNGKSMYPTLDDGEFCYSFVCSKNAGINRFDICVIQVDNKKLVKRVIGLPNETIEYKDNQLYIDGILTNESYLNDVYTEDLKIVLADDEYYCLGDNRDVSKDSRFYGPFKHDEFVSTNIFVVYPFSEFGAKK